MWIRLSWRALSGRNDWVIRGSHANDAFETIKLLAIYEEDLPRCKSLAIELQIYHLSMLQVPHTSVKTLESCPKEQIPKICTLLPIKCLLPIASCEATSSKSSHFQQLAEQGCTLITISTSRLRYSWTLTTSAQMNTREVVRKKICKGTRHWNSFLNLKLLQ